MLTALSSCPLPPDPSRAAPPARGERFSGRAAAAFADNFPFPAHNQSMTVNPNPGLSLPCSLFPVPCSLFFARNSLSWTILQATPLF
jgi:hypothetical protein